MLLDRSHKPHLRAVSMQRGPSFFEIDSGFPIKCLHVCTAARECLHRSTPQEWVLDTQTCFYELSTSYLPDETEAKMCICLLSTCNRSKALKANI